MNRLPDPRESLVTLVAVLALAAGSTLQAAELAVSIAGIESSSGMLMVAVLDSEAAFNGQSPAILSVMMPAKEHQVTFRTDALAPGEYGVRVMHDENGNGDMDENMVGMPTEPWGFSNNATGSFGPPGWADVRFNLEAATAITIDLNH